MSHKLNIFSYKGVFYTLENYKQFLDVGAYAYAGDEPSIRCDVKPLTSNYDFNDVKITLRVSGNYTVHNKVFLGYSSPGVPYYDATIKHSEASYNETFVLNLSIAKAL